MRSLSRLLLLALFPMLLFDCANPVAPTGGSKDERPPVLDTLRSTRNGQVRFPKQDIVFAFDEWVELRDVFNQVVVSPPLEFRPKVERRKKTIQFRFDDRETLRDSATYIINFGDAIRDMTEGNIAPVVFVFSTGDHIDSLSVEGTVIDAYTSQPVKDVLFMLYENLADSVFRKDRPFYFAKTNDKGEFKVNNIKAGRFKATALLDKNGNYRFDGETEKIAFLDSAVTVKPVSISTTVLDSLPPDSLGRDSASLAPGDSTAASSPPLPGQPPLLLQLFEEEKKLYLRENNTKTYGKVKLAFSRSPYDAVVTFDSIGQKTFLEPDKDTLLLWYGMDTDTAFRVFVKRDTTVDTVKVASGLKTRFLEKAKLQAATPQPTRLAIVPPNDPFELLFNHPVAALDVTLARLLEDSTKTLAPGQIAIAPDHHRKLLATISQPMENLRYQLELLPGCLTDLYGLQNADTIRRTWMSGAEKDFGSLTLKVNKLSPDTAYLLRLLAKNDMVVDTFRTAGKPTFETKLNFLTPDTYTLEIIEDLDNNGRWTTGSYDLKRQPERVQKATLEPVRANWEVAAEVDVRFGVIVAPPAAQAPASSGPPRGPR